MSGAITPVQPPQNYVLPSHDTLYHYCTNDTFLKIIEGKCLQLSDLRLSNDTMEGSWVQHVVAEMCASDPVLAPHTDRISAMIEDAVKTFANVGFCLSEDGDSLSQWRGYADDGQGMSIGFSKEKLRDSSNFQANGIAVNMLQRVEYDASTQRSRILPILLKIKEGVEQGAFSVAALFGLLSSAEEREIKKQAQDVAFKKVVNHIFELFPLFYQYKNPAFREELEWRLIYYRIAEKQMSFFAKRDRIVPCKKFSFEGRHEYMITDVVIGPKNISDVSLVQEVMASRGYSAVTVRRSSATYR
ncbi:DUF2971 domain-containing protein [Aureimonas flava]|nr:DUF2971 domain-containing protein [Aureimonas flava]